MLTLMNKLCIYFNKTTFYKWFYYVVILYNYIRFYIQKNEMPSAIKCAQIRN